MKIKSIIAVCLLTTITPFGQGFSRSDSLANGLIAAGKSDVTKLDAVPQFLVGPLVAVIRVYHNKQTVQLPSPTVDGSVSSTSVTLEGEPSPFAITGVVSYVNPEGFPVYMIKTTGPLLMFSDLRNAPNNNTDIRFLMTVFGYDDGNQVEGATAYIK